MDQNRAVTGRVVEEAKKRFQQSMDALAPYLPPSDKFPDNKPVVWKRDDSGLPMSRPKAKASRPGEKPAN